MPSLPTEILNIIISHYYTPWSLYILDRNVGSLPIEGPPASTLHHVSHEISTLATNHERLTFSGDLIFTTPSTQWRILKRLPTISHRLSWALDHVRVLVFCSPPLFTSRIPWIILPSLQRVELDYCYRAANFRCQGTARELEAGYLDPLIASFARDTERFDLPVVEDAWKVVPDEDRQDEGQVEDRQHKREVESGSDGQRQIEVLVIKRMNVAEMPGPMLSPSDQPLRRRIENWKLKVIARHNGTIQDIRFEMVDGNHELPFLGATIWTAKDGFRGVVPAEQLSKLALKLKGTETREKYLVSET